MACWSRRIRASRAMTSRRDIRRGRLIDGGWATSSARHTARCANLVQRLRCSGVSCWIATASNPSHSTCSASCHAPSRSSSAITPCRAARRRTTSANPSRPLFASASTHHTPDARSVDSERRRESAPSQRSVSRALCRTVRRSPSIRSMAAGGVRVTTSTVAAV
jgi:hypothetical protein